VSLTLVLSVVAALLVGFLAGMLTLKRSTRWCPMCGMALRCPDCTQRLHGGRLNSESRNARW
jgi:hypothetical protein